jgi:hypothetical protein
MPQGLIAGLLQGLGTARAREIQLERLNMENKALEMQAKNQKLKMDAEQRKQDLITQLLGGSQDNNQGPQPGGRSPD